MSAQRKSELVPDRQHQTDFATVDGNLNVKGTIGKDAKERAEKHSAVNWRSLFYIVPLLAFLFGLFPHTASAQTYTPQTITSLLEIVDLSGLQVAVATLAGGALVAAFMVGGGFRIAKKGYSWMMSKI